MSSGAVAQQAEWAKRAKYAHLDASHHFVPVAVETSGPPIVPGPWTLPQGGNWGTKVLPVSPPVSICGCAVREYGGCRGISQGDPWTWGWRGLTEYVRILMCFSFSLAVPVPTNVIVCMCNLCETF